MYKPRAVLVLVCACACAAEMSRHNVVPVDGSARDLAVGRRVDGLAVFDNKAANDVLLEAEAQFRSGYPTIATSTLVRRNPILEESDDTQSDIKFFSQLVKPVKCRWRFEKEKLKTLAPSKHGFHPRSQSPTFQRLVEANEKLQGLVVNKTGANKITGDNAETKSEWPDAVERPIISRYAKSETQTHRGLNDAIETITPKFYERVEIKPEQRTEEKPKSEDVFVEEDEDDDEEDYKSGDQTPKRTVPKIKEFKVDFKKMDSHSELHLFLPHIDDAHSRLATPDNMQTANHKHTVALPSILQSKEISDLKVQDEDKTKQRKSMKSEYKRKKKKAMRIKSGNDDKQIRDRLNDVPTLISLENEKSDFHSSSMCVFQNCKQHSHYKKSSNIRQA